jgi:hypothetical protein
MACTFFLGGYPLLSKATPLFNLSAHGVGLLTLPTESK